MTGSQLCLEEITEKNEYFTSCTNFASVKVAASSTSTYPFERNRVFKDIK